MSQLLLRASNMPSRIARLLDGAMLDYVLRFVLALPFLTSGIVKLADFEAAVSEVSALGLVQPGATAALVIVTQLMGSTLFLSRRLCWVGAALLIGFTGLATLIAHPFWQTSGIERPHQATTFFEHMALIAGLGSAVVLVHQRKTL